MIAVLVVVTKTTEEDVVFGVVRFSCGFCIMLRDSASIRISHSSDSCVLVSVVLSSPL